MILLPKDETKGFPYCVNLDWVQFAIRLYSYNFRDLDKQNRVERLRGNNVFRHRIIIYDSDGSKWLTIMYLPYSSILDSSVATVQIGNAQLYNHSIAYSFAMLSQFCDYKFTGFSRIDLAVDFEERQQSYSIIRRLANGKYTVLRKKTGSIWWHKDGTKNVPHCLNWGSPQSDIKIKLYNKSREVGVIEGESNKPYITTQWEQANMNTKKVWRWEVSITSVSQLLIDGVTITPDNLDDTGFLCNWVSALYDSSFDVRDVSSKSKDGYGDRIQLLSLYDMPTKYRWREYTPVDDTRPAIEVATKLLSALESVYVLRDDTLFNAIFTNLATIHDRAHLQGWLRNRTRGMTLDDIYNHYYDMTGGGRIIDRGEPLTMLYT